uniref:Uncharacterized protein n=1 Tax=Rhizophora mucronata TaxID=61149 RepID=A0A2P2IT17_RHIMU
MQHEVQILEISPSLHSLHLHQADQKLIIAAELLSWKDPGSYQLHQCHGCENLED